MKTAFDLISDLYLTDMKTFTWKDKAVSRFCLIAGNITNDRTVLHEFLEYISRYYLAIFFIDGDLEHEHYDGNFVESYNNLSTLIGSVQNVVFLHENIIILDNVTLIGANGWTTFDFDGLSSTGLTIEHLVHKNKITEENAHEIFKLAINDQHYMYNSIDQCQRMHDCKDVLLITNSVPVPDFITHNDDFLGTTLGACTGNDGITGCLSLDKYGKVNTWIFGRFHEDLDYNINGVRYVSNPGNEIDPDIYFPKRIEI